MLFCPKKSPSESDEIAPSESDVITGGGSMGVSHGISIVKRHNKSCCLDLRGELWKLEPLSEERRHSWQREMDWLLSPTNYMVELVTAKQNGANGRTLEETLDSMVNY